MHSGGVAAVLPIIAGPNDSGLQRDGVATAGLQGDFDLELRGKIDLDGKLETSPSETEVDDGRSAPAPLPLDLELHRKPAGHPEVAPPTELVPLGRWCLQRALFRHRLRPPPAASKACGLSPLSDARWVWLKVTLRFGVPIDVVAASGGAVSHAPAVIGFAGSYRPRRWITLKPWLGLDLSCLEIQPETGVERYARRLVEHLPEMAPDLPFKVFVRPGRPAPMVRAPGELVVVPSLLPRVGWREAALPRAIGEAGIEVLHSPVAAVPFRVSAKRVATIHDVEPREASGRPERRLGRNRLRLLHAIRSTSAIIVPTLATRTALTELAPEIAGRIWVIPHGVDPDYRPEGFPLNRERYGIAPGPFLLWVGTLRKRKDPFVLLEAFRRLSEEQPDLQLVMCGKREIDEKELRARLEGSPAAKRFVLPGYAAREDLPDLYREALAVAVPSRLEGFGLCALEAMASGTPVVISDDVALREVCGEAALCFTAGEADELLEVLRVAIDDPGTRRRVIEAGLARAGRFSWRASAMKHIELYRRVHDS